MLIWSNFPITLQSNKNKSVTMAIFLLNPSSAEYLEMPSRNLLILFAVLLAYERLSQQSDSTIFVYNCILASCDPYLYVCLITSIKFILIYIEMMILYFYCHSNCSK